MKKGFIVVLVIAIITASLMVMTSCSVLDMLISTDGHTHEMTFVEATEPTCDKAGVKQHYICAGCDGIFADEKGYIALKDSDLAINPLGHQWGSASCTEPRKCNTCGATDGEPINHVPGEAKQENVVAGSCTVDGSYESVTYCDLCDKEIERKTVNTGKADHVPGEEKKENENAASCTENGSYDTVVYCSVCGTYEISRVTSTVAYTGHFDANGDKVCDACNSGITCEQHNPVTDKGYAATCTTDGLTDGSHCSLCNATIVAQQVIPSGGHSFTYAVSGNNVVYNVAENKYSGISILGDCSNCDEVDEITDYVVDTANSTLTYGETTIPVTISLSCVGGEFTLSEGTYAGITLQSATLTINGNVTVNGNINTEDSWLVIDKNGVLNVNNGSIVTVGSTVDDASTEAGKRYRFSVFGSLNMDGDNGENGLIVSNSLLFGSEQDNAKAIVNIKCGNGNALQTDGKTIVWWNFLNCDVNIEGIKTDGVSTSKAMYFFNNQDKHVDIMPNAHVTVKNCNDAIHTSGKWLYIGMHSQGILLDNTTYSIRCSYRVRVYSQEVVVVENYEHDGKTGTAYVKLHGNFIIGNAYVDDDPIHSDFSFVDFPTSEDYTTWTMDKDFIGWVE